MPPSPPSNSFGKPVRPAEKSPRSTPSGRPALPAAPNRPKGRCTIFGSRFWPWKTGGIKGPLIITTDLVGYPKQVADTVCNQIARQCGLRRSQIMLTCSHTHCGPVLAGALPDIYPLDDRQRALIAEYTPILEQTIIKTAAEALARMAPARLAVGLGQCGFAVNRRNNVEKQLPQVLAEHKPLKGPVDHSVPVLAVCGADGRLRAVLFLYACHNTVLTTSLLYSGDYAGFAQLALEEKHPDCLAMFTIGCGADQNGLPRGTIEIGRKYGTALAQSVDAVLAKPMKPVAASLHTDLEITGLPFEGPLSMEQLREATTKAGYLGRCAGEPWNGWKNSRPRARRCPILTLTRCKSGGWAGISFLWPWAARSWSITH